MRHTSAVPMVPAQFTYTLLKGCPRQYLGWPILGVECVPLFGNCRGELKVLIFYVDALYILSTDDLGGL